MLQFSLMFFFVSVVVFTENVSLGTGFFLQIGTQLSNAQVMNKSGICHGRLYFAFSILSFQLEHNC